MFPDSCPGTSKYLEVHYACVSAKNPEKPRNVPPWMKKQGQGKVNKGGKAVHPKANKAVPTSTAPSPPRKPILVTDKAQTTTTTTTTASPTTSTTTHIVEVNSRRINDLNSHR